MRTPFLLALAALLTLAACDSSVPDEELVTADLERQQAEDLRTARPPVGPSPAELALLEDRDCRTVAHAYLEAVSRGRFDYAAQFWNDPVIDGERLSAQFSTYVTPSIAIADVQEEGAAGTLYCTVSGVLTDASDPRVEPNQGEIVLRRANDVPGASAEQLRWTIRSSTFVEPMESSRREDAG